MDRDGLVEAIASVAAAVAPALRSAVVAADAGHYANEIAEALAHAHVEATSPTRENAARAGLGITSALLGVASTGSVLIVGGVDSPRAASILPEAHLVILPADRLVAGLEEALEAVASIADAYSNPFLVTGPSRTSDIEMQTVIGVHGPRSVYVILTR